MPKVKRSKTIRVAMSETMLAKLNKTCKEQGRNVSEVVRGVLAQYLKNVELN